MIDLVFKALGVVAAGVAAWYADEKLKEKTGKHFHEHVVDWLKAFWSRLKEWAQNYLAQHDRVRKIYVSALGIAATAKKALKAGAEKVHINIFGQSVDSKKPIVVEDEEIPLEQVGSLLEQAKREPILAMRN